MIRGVGPVYARKLVRAFGEKVFDIIEASPDRLREIDVIGPVRAASNLTGNWDARSRSDDNNQLIPPLPFTRNI